MKKIIILTVFVLQIVCQPILASEINKEKELLIDKLLAQTGQSAVTVGEQFSSVFIQQMVMVLKSSNPNIDPKAFEIIEEEIKGLIHEEIIENNQLSELMYPIYNKHFTAEDLNKMIEFNNTPLGKKLIRVMPLITQEGMLAGQTIGQKLGPKIQQRILTRLEKEGIKIQ